MKMTPEHYNTLQSRIATIQGIEQHRAQLSLDPKVKDLDKRLLWDVFHASKIYQVYSYQEFDYLDTHIETAVRKILSTI